MSHSRLPPEPTHHDVLVHPRQPHRRGLELDDVLADLAVTYNVQLPVTRRHCDPVAHLELALREVWGGVGNTKV